MKLNKILYMVFGVVALTWLGFMLYVNLNHRARAAATIIQTQIIKTVASSSTPEILGGTEASFRTIVFIGNKAARVANLGRVWIQLTSTNDSGAIPLQPSQVISFTADKNFLPQDFWIDVETNGDGIVAVFMPQ
jgi:hypothetical protein